MKKAIGIKIYAPGSYKNHEEAHLVFEITNLTGSTIHILKWNTPLEGLKTPCLDVRSGNKTVDYDGIMIKRGTPQEQDYFTLAPDQTVSNKIDLTEAYDISKPGAVSVNFNPDKFVYYTDQPLAEAVKAGAMGFKRPKTKIALDIKPASFKVSKGTAKRITTGQFYRQEEQKKKKAIKGVGFKAFKAAGILPCQLTGGTSDKQTKARNAHKNGYDLAKAALAGLAKDSRYKLWFGAYSKTRFNKVKSHYTKVVNRMETTEFTYNLTGSGCDSGVYAYTYKGTSTIWFCDAFWAAPDTGTDSRAGTVVHEHTHSDANTDDIQYGQPGCQQLAVSDPNKAVNNADTHEYYAGG